jgi:hypothetical protein
VVKPQLAVVHPVAAHLVAHVLDAHALCVCGGGGGGGVDGDAGGVFPKAGGLVLVGWCWCYRCASGMHAAMCQMIPVNENSGTMGTGSIVLT